MQFVSLDDALALRNGVQVPRLGLGTYKTPDGDVVEAAVRTALDHGYRHIDTASLYGNELGIGRGLAAAAVNRDEVFITTKVWNDEQGLEQTRAALDASLDRLGTDYVDLYLIHWPIPELAEQTWRAMEEALDAGKARAIGVCNHLIPHLESLMADARVMPAVNQIEFHFRLQQPELIDFCGANGIVIEAWAPLMRGRVVEIPEVVQIASAHGVTPFQVAVRWVLQRGIIAIPKSVHAQRIVANSDVLGFQLSEDEMSILDALDTGERIGRHPDSFADPATRPTISPA